MRKSLLTLASKRVLKSGALLLLIILLVLSCGRKANRAGNFEVRRSNVELQSSTPDSAFVTLQEAITEVKAVPEPEGADEKIFTDLKAELERLLRARGVDKFPSAPPSADAGNAITLVTDPAGLTWGEARWGDWNNDGYVSAQDLSPLAFNFGKNDNPGDPNYYKYAGYVDGSGDGIVNAGDLTPIAFHFGESTGGYNIYEANDSSGAGSVKVAEIARPPVQQDNENPPTNTSFATLQYDTSAGQVEPSGWVPTVGKWYRVVPFDNTPSKEESTTVSSSWAELKYLPIWAHTWGGMDYDYARDVALDGSGNIYVTGYNSFGAGGDVLLLKYDAAGNLLWAKTWGGTSGGDAAYALAVDGSGNLYVAGETSSFGAGSWDALLLKYNPSGNLLWARIWGGTSGDYVWGVAVDGSRNIYVVGDTYSFGAGNNDAFLLKYDQSGNLLWTKTWGGSNWELAEAVAVDGSGNIYVTGVTYSFGAGNADVPLLKYDQAGNLLWAKTWGGTSLDYGQDIAVDGSGNIYVTGYTYSFGAGSDDAFLLKYDQAGNLLWAKTWGGTSLDFGQGIAVDGSGNIYVTGGTNSFGGDIVLLKYDAAGNLLWAKTWGGMSGYVAQGWGLAVDGSGNIYVGGFAQNNSGSWATVSGTSDSPTGTEGSPAGTENSPSGTQGSPSGTVTSPIGVIDTGGGRDDVLLLKNYE